MHATRTIPLPSIYLSFTSRKTWPFEATLERERIIEEETRRTTAPRDLEPRLTMQLTVVHRGGSRSRWQLIRPIRGQFGFAEKGNDSRFDDESSPRLFFPP